MGVWAVNGRCDRAMCGPQRGQEQEQGQPEEGGNEDREERVGEGQPDG